MSYWEKVVVSGIYTASPLHVSTGQAEGAIDLPVVKEPHTGFPVIPASALKGVARDAYEEMSKASTPTLPRAQVEKLFGPDLRVLDPADKSSNKPDPESLFAGALVFTEARLVAFSVRSLNKPFLYATSSLVLERLARDLRAAKADLFGATPIPAASDKVLTTDKSLKGVSLVLEDLVYADGATLSEALESVANALTRLLPDDGPLRSSFVRNLVLLPDVDFASLVRRLPVRARIKLNERKTTTKDGGNLWYEEQVPADCLFASIVARRRQGPKDADWDAFVGEANGALGVTQIGGNETVGEGICYWTFHRAGGPGQQGAQ